MTAVTELLHLSAPAIQAAGTPLPRKWADALVAMRIERGIGVVGRATLRFTDPGYELAEKSLFPLGKEVAIAVSDGEALFSGVVTGASLEQSASTHPELVITADDLGHRLTLGTTVRTYLKMSFASIVERVVSTARGLTADVSAAVMNTSTSEYLLQTSNDLAFIDELCRRAGCVWWVDGKSFKVRAAGHSQGEVKVALGDELTDFSLRASGLRPTEVAVRGWDAKAQQDVTGRNNPPPATATSEFVQDYLKTRPAAALVKAEQQAGDSNPNNAHEATTLASALLTDWHAGAVIARGTGRVNAGIRPMISVNVENAGPASGKYVVSEVQHIYRQDGFHTRFVAGPVRPAGLVDTLGRTPPDVGFAISGLLTARVSNTRDPENGGRVKVTYAGSDSKVESAWARVVALGGGDNRGTVFHPETGDEVLVGFERGDSRHPVVIGGLYSPKNSMPLSGDNPLLDGSSKVNYRRITSRLGHIIELGDGANATEQHILLRTADARKSVRVGADRVDVTTATGTPIAVQSGNAKFEIDKEGNITIDAKQISIKAQTQLTLEGQTVEVKGRTQATVQAATVDVKGAGQANVTAGAQLALKGAMVMIN